jgi:hypothetical protein
MVRSFWIKVAVASLCATLLLLTLVWHDWIEIVFGVDPDGGSGLTEWAITAAVTLAAVGCGASALVDWRRAHA